MLINQENTTKPYICRKT